VDVAPQGYPCHDVLLRPGHRAALEMTERPGALLYLDPGDYDVYVQNESGKGRPYPGSGPRILNPNQKSSV